MTGALRWCLALGIAVGAFHWPSARAFDILEATIPELQSAMARGDLTSADLVRFYLRRIAAYDDDGPLLNAVIATNPEALQTAERLDDQRTGGGTLGPLHGIPVLVKDNFETRDMPTTAGSRTLAGWVPPHDAFLVARLRAAGAVILGKTTMHEFAYGITTVGSAFGATRNPYDPARNPGGSSGGTGAAIAANLAVFGLGSDTCGSIRIPSAQNNLVGLRGSTGLASRTGIVPLALTQDIGGPLARSVTDLAIALDHVVGFDPDDPQTAAAVGNVPTTYTNHLVASGLRGARIGLAVQMLGDADEEERAVTAVIGRASREMSAQGATVVDVEVPELRALLDDGLGGYRINVSEFKFDLERYLEAHPSAPIRSLAEVLASEEYHPAVKGVLELSQGIDSLDTPAYRRAVIGRRTLRESLLVVMASHGLDALLYPTIRRPPALLGEEQDGNNCHLAANSGLPAISVPAGFTPAGLPVGAELLGRQFAEPRLIELAYSFEQATGYRRLPASVPPL